MEKLGFPTKADFKKEAKKKATARGKFNKEVKKEHKKRSSIFSH